MNVFLTIFIALCGTLVVTGMLMIISLFADMGKHLKRIADAMEKDM